jgi:hypothetical protein
MDIEDNEWLTFPNILQTGDFHTVRQLCVEIHLSHNTGGVVTHERYIEAITILRDLYQIGFKIFHTQRNMGCGVLKAEDGQRNEGGRANCFEICFMREVL